MQNSLVLSDVSKIFLQGDETCIVLDHISYEFKQGTSYAIMGISGSGKSTLLSLLAGIDKPTGGQAVLKRGASFGDKMSDTGIALHEYATALPREFFHQTVGIVFQTPYLIHELSVLENVFIKGLIAGQALDACKEKAIRLLESVNLAHKAASSCATLSLGEQQRVSLVRALFCEPAFLLADEPTAHLDVLNRELMINLIRDYQSRRSMGIILTCHDRYVADKMDVRAEIVHGRLIQHGESLA